MIKLKNLISEVIRLQDVTFGHVKKDNDKMIKSLLNSAQTLSIKGEYYRILKNKQHKMINWKEKLLLIAKKYAPYVFYIQVLGFSRATLEYLDDEKLDVSFISTKDLLQNYRVSSLSELYKKIMTQKNLKGYNPPYLICRNLLTNIKYEFYLNKQGQWCSDIQGYVPIHLFELAKVYPIAKYQNK